MISRDPIVSNIRQSLLSSSGSSKQSVVSKWVGSVSLYVSTFISQADTGLSETITPSSGYSPILISVSLPYNVYTNYSTGAGWTIAAIVHAYEAGGDPLYAVPVGSTIISDRRTMSTFEDTEDIQATGVLSADFIVGISSPTTFYVSISAQPSVSPVSVSVAGGIFDFYDSKSGTFVADHATMTLTEVDTWIS